MTEFNLNTCEFKMLAFNNMEFNAKIIEVIDGDTYYIGFIWEKVPIKIKMRLYGCDCPELHPLKTCNDLELHIECGKLIVTYVKQLIETKIVKVKTNNRNDCYGRMLGDIIFINNGENINLSEHLIKCNFAKKYYGNKKEQFAYDYLNNIKRNLNVKCIQ